RASSFAARLSLLLVVAVPVAVPATLALHPATGPPGAGLPSGRTPLHLAAAVNETLGSRHPRSRAATSTRATHCHHRTPTGRNPAGSAGPPPHPATAQARTVSARYESTTSAGHLCSPRQPGPGDPQEHPRRNGSDTRRPPSSVGPPRGPG